MNPKELLDTLLGYLGFAFEIQESEAADGTVTLQIYTSETDRLVGPDGCAPPAGRSPSIR